MREGCVVSPREIADILAAEFSGAVADAAVEGEHPCITVTAAHWPAVARFLRDDPRTTMNLLRCISACDGHPEPHMDVIYELLSLRPAGTVGGLWEHGGHIAIRVRLPRDEPRVRTVSDVWPAADWHEREAFDLLGVVFDQHPDPRRILCPDDWEGFPLRKDYVAPKEYQGFPAAHEPESPDALPQLKP